jgi:hypothetical protein
VTYQPDGMTHLVGQYPGSWCTKCTAQCSEAMPCTCCGSEVPKFATGGIVSEGKDDGDDTVLALLHPGEAFVVPEPEVEASAEPQAEVQFITDDDAGVAGEANGG